MSTRSELLEQLRELGVETVTAEYDGSGDEGQIGTPEGGSVSLPHELAMAVEELFYGVLEELYAGWENNEGGFGQFVWNVQADKIHLAHSTRFESYDTEERDL